MNEQKALRKQFFKYVRSNLLTFIVIFILFGLFMYFLVSRITYTSVNIELREGKDIVENTVKTSNLNTDDFKNLQNEIERFIEENFNFQEELNNDILNNISNPKIICIIRDEDGNIVNTSGYGTNVQDLLNSLEFSNKEVDNIYEISIEDEYYYRGLTIDLSEINPSEEEYVQLLINVDMEKDLVHIYSRFIIYSVIFGIALSVIASIIMARKTLLPIYINIKKQNEFVQDVAHELRTPLTIIQTKQELLLSDPNAKIIDKSEDISLTLNETKRLSKLIKDLTLLVRGDNKELKLEKEEVDVNEMVRNISKTYSDVIEADGKILELDLNYKGVILVDTNQIYQVIEILLDNAIKYTEKGDTITIRTYLKDNKCNIDVADTGIGISDEAMKHVFERFYREDKTRSRETGGTGLGLSIADMIVSTHGGTIKVAHNGDKGTVFTIRLPR